MGFMVKRGVVFGAVIGKIVRARSPKEAELTLSFMSAEPVVLHVHGFCLLLNDVVGRYTHASGVIVLDGGFGLRPTHFNDGISKWKHGLDAYE